MSESHKANIFFSQDQIPHRDGYIRFKWVGGNLYRYVMNKLIQSIGSGWEGKKILYLLSQSIHFGKCKILIGSSRV